MISAKIQNRLIFFLTLAGLGVSLFLYYEYSLAGPLICPLGSGCDIVRASPYSRFLGISLPILGIIFYLFMASLSVFRAQHIQNKNLANLQLAVALGGASFGMYLTFLEVFIIQAICFWCVLSFIISIAILLLVFLGIFKKKKDEHRD